MPMRVEVEEAVAEMLKARTGEATVAGAIRKIIDVAETNRLLREFINQQEELNVLSDVWEFVPITLKSKEIKAGESESILYLEKEKGKLLLITFYSNEKEIKAKIRVDGRMFTEGSAELLNSAGYIRPMGFGLWCSRYDTTNDIYYVVLSPSVMLPYRLSFELTLENPTNSAVTVHYNILRYKKVR